MSWADRFMVVFGLGALLSVPLAFLAIALAENGVLGL